MLAEADRAEMAVPSYTHRNPLIRWLFWKRLDLALSVAELTPGLSVFEFGTGTGVLLPSLTGIAKRVAATDLFLEPATATTRALGLTVELVTHARFSEFVEANRGMFDRLFALDVLEHLDEAELRSVAISFRRLLRPTGRLVVSGPTESAMYHVGRFIAGFKGDYHHRNIFDIDAQLREHFACLEQRTTPRPPLPKAFVVNAYAPKGE